MTLAFGTVVAGIVLGTRASDPLQPIRMIVQRSFTLLWQFGRAMKGG